MTRKWNGPGVLRIGKKEYKPGSEIPDTATITSPVVKEKVEGKPRKKKDKGGK